MLPPLLIIIDDRDENDALPTVAQTFKVRKVRAHLCLKSINSGHAIDCSLLSYLRMKPYHRDVSISEAMRSPTPIKVLTGARSIG